jgi:hypothetical protein
MDMDAQLATLIERLDNLKADTSRRHDENKETLGEILNQTKKTNGRVDDLEKWRDTHEAVTKERDGQFSTKVDDQSAAISVLSEDRIQRKAIQRFILLAIGPIAAIVGAVAGHLISLLEKAH